eukprot:TRINITY_DN26573_c0_g1_i1.p1 TRINITY_DN26573_c0_g1~~TRINITY_DN26573_c0_g1_i1.p1  ORF type:complete len:483 (+),score=76.61 TRINITY_DN26573_c0_g1_i1:56-1504(+)
MASEGGVDREAGAAEQIASADGEQGQEPPSKRLRADADDDRPSGRECCAGGACKKHLRSGKSESSGTITISSGTVSGKAGCWVPSTATPLCPAGHVMVATSENPANYKNMACCDVCGLPNLAAVLEQFFHCDSCKFDECPECLSECFRYRLQKGGVIELLQDTSATVAVGLREKSCGNLSKFAWRVWGAAPTIARYVEARYEAATQPAAANLKAKRPVALELGAGGGLVSLVLRRLQSHDVVITDLPGALALTRDGLARNDLAGASSTQQQQSCPSLHCPEHHGPLTAIQGLGASTPARPCAACGLAADTEGARSCGSCNFVVCEKCVEKARSSDLAGLPVWFQLQCRFPPSGLPLRSTTWSEPPAAFVRPLDWSRQEDVDELRREFERCGLEAPSLVIAADVAYDKDLVKILLSTLERLQKWIRESKGADARAELVFGHMPRSKVRLFEGLRARGIVPKKVTSEDVDLEGGGLVNVWTGKL